MQITKNRWSYLSQPSQDALIILVAFSVLTEKCIAKIEVFLD